MTDQLTKTTFFEISKHLNKPIVLFGSGNIATKTIRKLSGRKVECIVDNSKNLQGTYFNGLEVKDPNSIRKDQFIIICSTAITEISKQLIGYGLKPNLDFVISPILNDLLAIKELEELSTTFFFTSGTIASDEPLNGGGLYKCRVNGSIIDLNKIYSGPCYGAQRVDDTIIFIDTDKGLMKYNIFNKSINLIGDLPAGSRAHGVSFNPVNSCYYITCSYLDAVLELNKEGVVKRRFQLSAKTLNEGEPLHHCNDNCVVGNSLYVTMFSSTGNWKRGSFDGCIAEFDLKSGQRLPDIYQGLYMPHNILFIDGLLHVLDSLPGHLRFNNFSIQGTFPAFTRGLSYSNGLYFVGQSKNRNYSKVFGLSNNISIDCGVIVFHPELKVSRFLQFPLEIGEIHSIIL